MNIFPDDDPAMFRKVVDTSGKIKDKDNVVQLHKDIREVMEKLLPNASFLGYVMDSTATNVAATKVLQGEDPSVVVLPRAAHALSNLIKHAAKFFSWVNDAYRACCSISDYLIDSQKLRTALHALQIEEYQAVRCICAHVPTHFGSRHLVLLDVINSKAALRRLVSTQERKNAVAGSTGMQNANDMIVQLEDDLFDMGSKVEELSKVMDSIYRLEADQPMISFLLGIFDNLGMHLRQFGQDNPGLAHGTILPDRRKRRPSATRISLSELLARD
jgi:hypothetical protein